MKLSQDQQEKVTMGIQAVLGVLVIGLTVRNSAKVQSAQMKKAAKKQANAETKMKKLEYKQRTKLMKEKYKNKMKDAKQHRFVIRGVL